MTRYARLLSAALAATSVAALGVSTANATVIPRPTINIPTIRPTVNVPSGRVALPTVTRAPTTLPATHTATLPATHTATVPTTHVATLPQTHAPTQPQTHAPTLPATHAPEPGVPLPADHVAIPPNPTSSVAAELNGKPVIKVSYVNGNEMTVFYLSPDAKHVLGAVSSISAPNVQQPATHAPPQNVATTQPSTNHPAASNEPAAHSSPKVTFTPVSYPEITDALGRPIGYVRNGQPVYFPNGQMPYGFVVGPNHTIETYLSSTSAPTPTPVSKPAPAPAPAPAPQHPSSNQPAPSHHTITFTPVKYQEITNAYGSPIGYVNAQGQAVYFPNGQMPAGFGIGPNHTIITYIKSQT